MHHCLRQIFAYLIGRPMIFLQKHGRVERMSQVTVFCRHTTRCVFSERRFFSTGKTWPTEMKVWKHTGQPLPHVGCPNAIWKRQLQSKVRVRRKKIPTLLFNIVKHGYHLSLSWPHLCCRHGRLIQSPYFLTPWLRLTEHCATSLSGWTDLFGIMTFYPD